MLNFLRCLIGIHYWIPMPAMRHGDYGWYGLRCRDCWRTR